MTENRRTKTKQLGFPMKRILVPIDGSPNSLRALDCALGLAKSYDSEVLILSVVVSQSFRVRNPAGFERSAGGLPRIYEEQKKFAKDLIDQSVERGRKEQVRMRGEVAESSSSVVESILRKAGDYDADLIVMGTRGLGGFRRLMLGSVSRDIASHAKCNVMIVR